jgi:hypothetical protein
MFDVLPRVRQGFAKGWDPHGRPVFIGLPRVPRVPRVLAGGWGWGVAGGKNCRLQIPALAIARCPRPCPRGNAGCIRTFMIAWSRRALRRIIRARNHPGPWLGPSGFWLPSLLGWSYCRTLCDCIEPPHPGFSSSGRTWEEIALPPTGHLWQVNAAVKPTWRNWQTR